MSMLGSPMGRTSGANKAMLDAAEALKDGKLVVLPTDTVYGIAADAFQKEAVSRLLAAKGRGRQMPPPVLVGGRDSVNKLATNIPPAVAELTARFWPGPLTIILPAHPDLQWDLGDMGATVALRMPDHPLTLELLRSYGPLAVTSANLTGRKPALTVKEARDYFADSVEVYLDGGTAFSGLPSTILDMSGQKPVLLRPGGVSLCQMRHLVGDICTYKD